MKKDRREEGKKEKRLKLGSLEWLSSFFSIKVTSPHFMICYFINFFLLATENSCPQMDQTINKLNSKCSSTAVRPTVMSTPPDFSNSLLKLRCLYWSTNFCIFDWNARICLQPCPITCTFPENNYIKNSCSTLFLSYTTS